MVLNWLFFGFIVIGAFLRQSGYVSVFRWPVGEEVFQLQTGNMVVTVVSIFLFNLFLSGFLVVTLTGLLFFVLPVVFLCVRGFLWGLLLSGLSSSQFLSALPTVILEGEGYVLAALVGVVLGLSWAYAEMAVER